LDISTPQNAMTTSSRNVGNQSPSDASSYPRLMETSVPCAESIKHNTINNLICTVRVSLYLLVCFNHQVMQRFGCNGFLMWSSKLFLWAQRTTMKSTGMVRFGQPGSYIVPAVPKSHKSILLIIFAQHPSVSHCLLFSRGF